MDKLVSGMQRKFRSAQNKKGMTMFSLFLIIVVIIFLTIIFSNPDFIRKINRGRVTTAWSNELSSLSNGVLSLNNHVNILFPVRIKGSDGLDVVVPAPTLSAYEPVQSYSVMKNPQVPSKNISISYDGANNLVVSGLDMYTDVKTSAPTFPAGTQPGTGADVKVQLDGLSKLGSDGITSFINKSIANIEESLFLGLLNQANTDLGNNFTEKGKLDLTPAPIKTTGIDYVGGGATFTGLSLADCQSVAFINTGDLVCGTVGANNKVTTKPITTYTKTSMEVFMSMVFGTGSMKDLQMNKPTSWVSLKPVNSKALKGAVGSNYRFYNTDDFTLFWVDSVAPKADAISMFRQFFKMDQTQAKAYTPGFGCATNGTDCGPNEIQLAGEIYDRMLQFIQPDSLVVIPTTKSGAVYSSNSDFRLYKFSTAD